MNNGLWTRIGDFWKKLDPSSKPAFFMFAVVLFAAGGLNYVGLSPVVGSTIAVAIALFFGVGVLSWHIVEARTDDSKYQEDVAQIVKWANVVFDGALIFVNLFRADLRAMNGLDGMTAWDTAAFAIIGASAASHVVGYLLWTQNDPHRMAKKELERRLNTLNVKGERSNIAVKETELHMKKLKWIEDEAVRLRAEYSGVPGINVENMIREMRSKAVAEFEGVKQQDTEKTKAMPAKNLMVSNAQEVPQVQQKPDPTNAGKPND